MEDETVEEAAKAAGADQARKGSVLVVDDDEFSRDLLSRRLKRAGYQVTATGDGREVSELLGKHSFHLALLDVVMPGIGGREVLASILASSACVSNGLLT